MSFFYYLLYYGVWFGMNFYCILYLVSFWCMFFVCDDLMIFLDVDWKVVVLFEIMILGSDFLLINFLNVRRNEFCVRFGISFRCKVWVEV